MESYLILLTPYILQNAILQSYFILVRHHHLFTLGIRVFLINNKKELKKLWDGIPLEFLNTDNVNSKGFKRIDLKALIEVNGGKDFTIAILKLLKPLFSTYSVEFTDPMHLIVSSGNTDPYHQDIVTGS